MDDRKKNYDLLEKYSKDCGASVFGAANITGCKKDFHIEPIEILKGLDFAISLGVRLSGKVLETVKDQPSAMYSFHYKRINILLDEIVIKVSNFIQEQEYDALPIMASQISDWDLQIGHVCHRTIGKLSGNGFIGRSGLLVNPKYGAQVRYATVLTNMPLSVGKELDMNCAECEACMSACPSGAIKKTSQDFDKQSCLKLLKEFSKKPFIGQYICGVCVRACGPKK